MGGSTTHCHYLPDDRTWPSRLGDRLGVWLNNAGINGQSSESHLVLLQSYITLMQPDMVLFLVGVNDMGRSDFTPVRFVARANGPLGRASRHSALLASVLHMVRMHSEASAGVMNLPRIDLEERAKATGPFDESTEVSREKLDAYEDRLHALVTLSRAHDIEPVLLTQPALYGPATDDVTGVDLGAMQGAGNYSGRAAWARLEQFNDRTRALAIREGVLLVDLAREFPKSSRFYQDLIHYSDEGAELLAELVADRLCPHLVGRVGVLGCE